MDYEHATRIRTLLFAVRSSAQRVGPFHAAWDMIWDGEALLTGRKRQIPWTPAAWIGEAQRMLLPGQEEGRPT